ncbi:hypothetical protein C8J57DRAFT_1477644 [Mycena rebaudengoi]|nr:hypothetical protein C8J57DRAFT_1477644 [Mycena rebaudengoi]
MRCQDRIPGETVRPNPRPRFRFAASLPMDNTPDFFASAVSTESVSHVEELSNMPAMSPTTELVLPSADRSAGFPTLDPDVSSDDEEDSGKRKRCTGHSRKRQHQVILSDDEKDCDDPGCAETGDLETIACSGPACTSKFHLCCRGLKKKPTGAWFCDDFCRENAGGRARKKARSSV